MQSSLKELTWSLMVRASSMAAAMSVIFQGLTRMAPAPSDCAAPANSLNTSTPAFHETSFSRYSAALRYDLYRDRTET